ncbi:THAP-type domain-containing protein, partial [Aphis craccivora]
MLGPPMWIREPVTGHILEGIRWKCVVCLVDFDKTSERKFHKFPNDEIKKNKWMVACNIKLLLPSYTVCSDHFLSQDYNLKGILKKDAIPKRNGKLLKQFTTDVDEKMQYNSESSTPKRLKTTLSSQHDELLKQFTTDDDEKMQYNSESSTPKRLKTTLSSQCFTPKKRIKQYNPDSIGLLSPTHFSTPKRRKRNVDLIKQKFKEKQSQYHKIYMQNKRLRLKLKSYDDLIMKLRNKNLISENASYHLQSMACGSLTDIIKRKLSGKKVPYSDELKKFAVTLQFYSSKAYTFVRKQFFDVLPHPRTLTKWYQGINGDPGFTKESFDILKLKVNENK